MNPYKTSNPPDHIYMSFEDPAVLKGIPARHMRTDEFVTVLSMGKSVALCVNRSGQNVWIKTSELEEVKWKT